MQLFLKSPLSQIVFIFCFLTVLFVSNVFVVLINIVTSFMETLTMRSGPLSHVRFCESFSGGGFSYFGFPRQYLSQRCTLTKPCFQNQQLCSKYGEFRSTACHSIWLIFVSKRELCKTGKITIWSSLNRIQRLGRKALLLSRLHHTAHTPDNNSAFCCSILAWPPL